MPAWNQKLTRAALNTARYNVPDGYVCAVAVGVEMVVRSGFRIDGILVLDGMLTVKGRTKWA